MLSYLQLGCGCSLSTCCPETCDHVYLFNNDYEYAKDIDGKLMEGRLPYDDKGRLVLEVNDYIDYIPLRVDFFVIFLVWS